MGEDDYLEDDNEEFSPPPPSEDVEVKSEKKEEPKKEETKPQLAIGIENIGTFGHKTRRMLRPNHCLTHP